MSNPVTIALVGLSGYGRTHVNMLLDRSEGKNVQLVAAIDVNPDRCNRLQDLRDAGAKIYPSLEEFYGSGGEADLVIIASPIHFHAPQMLTALKNGSNVLCEKPAAATIQDAIAMADAADAAGKIAAIGYQWSYSTTIQALKQDVIDGIFGRPIRMKTFTSWPRPESYYKDRHWAAKIKSEDGAWILDSPVHNATSHYLHNCFYVLGETPQTSAMPVDIQAELYCANPVENYDTAMLRAHTENGVEILFFVSHAVPSNIGPVFSYEFENATVIHEQQGSGVVLARFRDGRTKKYGNSGDGGARKCWTTVDAVRAGGESLCGVRAAIPETLCVNGAQESTEIASFPDKMISIQNLRSGPVTVVNGLQDSLIQCFNLGILPHEHGGISWAQESKVISLRDYTHFPSHTYFSSK